MNEICPLLQLEPSEHRILLTDPPLNPKGHRERLVETMFETYGFSGVYLQVQAVLALFSQGAASPCVRHISVCIR